MKGEERRVSDKRDEMRQATEKDSRTRQNRRTEDHEMKDRLQHTHNRVSPPL